MFATSRRCGIKDTQLNLAATKAAADRNNNCEGARPDGESAATKDEPPAASQRLRGPQPCGAPLFHNVVHLQTRVDSVSLNMEIRARLLRARSGTMYLREFQIGRRVAPAPKRGTAKKCILSTKARSGLRESGISNRSRHRLELHLTAFAFNKTGVSNRRKTDIFDRRVTGFALANPEINEVTGFVLANPEISEVTGFVLANPEINEVAGFVLANPAINEVAGFVPANPEIKKRSSK